jgi:hypothetical protein
MWMQDERSGEPTEEQPSISHTFRQVYRFILRAMQGDTAVARALFQQYLAGELPGFIAALRARRSSGAACKKIKKAGRFAKSTVPPEAILRQRPVSSRTSEGQVIVTTTQPAVQVR